MDAINTIQCLIDSGVMSETEGNELIKVLRPMSDSAEAIKILAGLNIISGNAGLTVPSHDVLISDNGDTDIEVVPGQLYLLTLKGDYNGGAATVSNNNGPAGSFEAVDSGDLSEGVRTEADVSPSTSTLRVTLTGATDPELRLIVIPRN